MILRVIIKTDFDRKWNFWKLQLKENDFQIEQSFIWNKTGNFINFHFQENRFLHGNRSKVFTRRQTQNFDHKYEFHLDIENFEKLKRNNCSSNQMFLLNILIFWLMKMLTCPYFGTGLDFWVWPQYRFPLWNSVFFI